jgi:hypothetical protein
LSSLPSLIEFFIGLAGFSGIIVALSGSSVASIPLDRFRVLVVLGSTLGGGVFAALWLMLVDSGGSEETAWAGASAAFAVCAAFFAFWGRRYRVALPAQAHPYLHPIMGLVGDGGLLLASIALLANTVGWPAGTSALPYLCSLLFLLLYSCALFIRLLLVRPSGSFEAQ